MAVQHITEIYCGLAVAKNSLKRWRRTRLLTLEHAFPEPRVYKLFKANLCISFWVQLWWHGSRISLKEHI